MSRGTGPLISIVTADGAVLCRECRVADSFWSRLRGLLGTTPLRGDEGLLIPRTSSIHTHFMSYAIDVVFVDAEGRVRKLARDLRPWRVASCPGARDVVEVPSGRCDEVGLAEGAVLVQSARGVRLSG